MNNNLSGVIIINLSQLNITHAKGINLYKVVIRISTKLYKAVDILRFNEHFVPKTDYKDRSQTT